MFFDRRCPICGRASRPVCRECASSLTRGERLRTPGVDDGRALLAYDERSSRLILAGKNGGRRDLLRWSAALLAADLARQCDLRAVDVVTWVPAHPTQRRARGFDQGEILARTVARRLGRPCRSTLRRRAGASRKGLDRMSRLDGPVLHVGHRVPATIVLIDDVVTTGATLSRSAEALRSGGAKRIIAGVVAASAPDRGAHRATAVSTIYIGSSSGVSPPAT